MKVIKTKSGKTIRIGKSYESEFSKSIKEMRNFETEREQKAYKINDNSRHDLAIDGELKEF